jgi:hypothetical protein
MNVIGHQDVGMDDAIPIGSRLLQPMEVAVIVLLGKEARLSIDASLNEMHRHSGKMDSRAAWHGQRRIDAMPLGLLDTVLSIISHR